jgi:hypothetical protein
MLRSAQSPMPVQRVCACAKGASDGYEACRDEGLPAQRLAKLSIRAFGREAMAEGLLSEAELEILTSCLCSGMSLHMKGLRLNGSAPSNTSTSS